jgi:cytochrome c-type biogenesis protein CcmE
MKKTHIAALIGIVILIVGLLTFATGNADFSTYDSIQSAKNKPGQFVHMIAKLDKNYPVEYDAIKNPNYTSFYATDSLGSTTKVVFKNAKPADLEKSERLVLKGKMEADQFSCSDILLKCPSKYKDDEKQLTKEIENSTTKN